MPQGLRTWTNKRQGSSLSLDDRPVGHDGRLGDDHDTVANHVIRSIAGLELPPIDDLNVAADAAIFIQDGLLDGRAITDPEVWNPAFTVLRAFRFRLKPIRADHDAVAQIHVVSDPAADADDAALDPRPGLDHTAIADQTLIQASVAHARGRKKAHAGINHTLGAMEIKRWIVA